VDEKFAYWRDRWLNKMLGWHLENPHPVLMTHLNDWLGDDGETQRSILFPLCGASVDLGCIARRGHQVVGVEAVPEAILAGRPADDAWCALVDSWVAEEAATDCTESSTDDYDRDPGVAQLFPMCYL
jgi:hypothetical protein